MADSPHVLDSAGREALRQDLIAEIRKLGEQPPGSISIDDARTSLKRLQESGPLPRSESLHLRRTASEAHADAEQQPSRVVRRVSKKQ